MTNPFEEPPRAIPHQASSNPFAVPGSPERGPGTDDIIKSLSSIANPFDDSAEDSYDEDDDETPRWLREARDALPAAPAAAPVAQPTSAAVAAAHDGNPFATAHLAVPDNPWTQPAATAEAAPAAAPSVADLEPRPWSEASLQDAIPLLSEEAAPTPVAVAAPASPTPIEVDEATFAADMAHGCASLLASGRHADVDFELPARTLKAHRCVLEARCGAELVEAIEHGRLGEVVARPSGGGAAAGDGAAGDGAAGGTLRVRLAAPSAGDASGASVAALLRYIYTERFEPTSLGGRAGCLALLRLATLFAGASPSAALLRLRQLCEAELARGVDAETVVSTAHASLELGASQLLRFCLQTMNASFASLLASGGLRALDEGLCAELFELRSDAPLQDALAHGRADVAERLLNRAAAEAAGPPAEAAGGPEGTPAPAPAPGGAEAAASERVRSLLERVDACGRTALEVALVHDELGAARSLLARGAPVDAMAGGGDEPLLHVVCCAPRPPDASEALLEGVAGGLEGGAAAAHAARHELCLQKVTLLLEHGACVDAMNGRGESALDVAFFRGGDGVVALLLGHGATSMMATEDGGCLLHSACLSRRADVLKAILGCLPRIRVDLNQQDRVGRTPLHVAVSSGAPELVQPLLSAKASTEVQEDDGATPLRLAVSQGDLALTSMLLGVGADKNALGADAVPLIVLATEASVHVALALVKAGADLNQPDATGRTALEVAISRKEYELSELLLAKGARPTSRKDPHGNTSLHVAVAHQAEGLVRLLVRHRAELSEQNRQGQTPLIMAAESGQVGVVELLLHSGAHLHLCDASNRSALELALSAGHLNVLKVLLQQSMVDVNGMSKRGSSLLHLAAELGDEGRVGFLLEMQASVDVLNANGETPLHWACSLGHLAVVRALVTCGANAMVHERVQGLTPLHAACGSRSQPAVLALLIQRCEAMAWSSNPARCNLLDGNRNTPLHTATKLAPQAGKYLPLLLEHGANPNLQNGQGQTALHLLAERAVREAQEREQRVRQQQQQQQQQQQSAVGSREPGANGHANGADASQLSDAQGGDGDGGGGGGGGGGGAEFPALRLLEVLAATEHTLQLDLQEAESGNTALHHAAFGGCIELAIQLVGLGASVGLPNRDGFTPLDSSMRSASEPSRSLQSLLLSHIQKPMSWTPDRTVSACQSCKLPFNKADPKMARKHHCRHCGRCICSLCSPHRMAIPKFGSEQQERVCLLCERVLTEGA